MRGDRRTLPRLRVLQSHPLPVQQIAQPLNPVPLVDPLPPRLLAEREHLIRQLSNRILDGLHAAVDDVDTAVSEKRVSWKRKRERAGEDAPVVLRVFEEVFHETTEAGEVGRDRGNTHDSALGGSVCSGKEGREGE
jgi:hypothetical protein